MAFGVRAPDTRSLRDLRGNQRALHDLQGARAIAIAFVGVECPVSNLYLPGLVELEKKYRKQGVQFLAVYPNPQEDVDLIAGHAYDRNVPFLVLRDLGHEFADALGVSRVPTVVVLDGDHKLRYRGRVDDQYGVSGRRPKATRADLAEAIEEVLAGKKVSIAETAADGCLIAGAAKSSAPAQVTYSKHVAPIVQARCQVCHRAGQIAPFTLSGYGDAVKHARMIREVAEQRRMPPWHADPRYGQFHNSRRLSRTEIDTIAAWVDGGMLRGDARDLPKPPAFAEGWVHGKPDVVFEMPAPFDVPATGVVPYKNHIIDPKFDDDVWVQTAECRPGAPGVVHHIVVYIMRPGQRGPLAPDGNLSILVGWAPGDLGLVLPPDTARRIPKGSKLRLEMHYTPNGTAVKDRSSVGIRFARQPPRNELLQAELANVAIEVPPYDPHYKAEATFRLPADARLISLAPHMHWRGKHYFYEAIYPDGKKQTLLSVPRWDFNWQNVYRFEEPIKLPKGTRIHTVAHWDNSSNNLLNPAPEKSVRFGLQSWEEMMVGFVSYVWERPETAAELAKNPPKQSDLFFDRLDLNGDDVISGDEIPARFRAVAPLAGITLPERMTRAEFERLFGEMMKRVPKGKKRGQRF
ncbi:MAG: redoxin family protein [Gemmataceae bacterium]|nr:redoxin family protein [Gemmataceae bacterium]